MTFDREFILLSKIRELSGAIVDARKIGFIDAIPVFQAHLDKVLVEYQDHRANAQNSPTGGGNNRETQNAVK